MLLSELKRIVEDQTLFTVVNTTGDETTGYALKVSEELVMMAQYTEEGIFDGYSIFALDQIAEFYWGDRYHESVERLIDKKIKCVTPDITLDTLESAIVEANQSYEAMAFYETGDSQTFDVAEVLAIQDGWIKLYCFGNKKNLSRTYRVIDIDNYIKIEFDTPYINSVVALHR